MSKLKSGLGFDIEMVNVTVSKTDGTDKETYEHIIKDEVGAFMLEILSKYLVDYNKEPDGKTAMHNLFMRKRGETIEAKYGIKVTVDGIAQIEK